MIEEPESKYGELLRRIETAREEAGIPSERKLCLKAGVGVDAVRSIRKRGHAPKAETLAKLARALGKSPSFLLDVAGEEEATVDSQFQTMIELEELDVRAGAGGNGAIINDFDANGGSLMEKIAPVSQWRIPVEMTQAVTNATPDHIKIITIVGNSMVPDFRPGQKVMVDTTDKIPSPPGVFVVWDGLSLVVKLIEHIPFSDPPSVRIMSKNTDFQPYERTLEEAYIQGRVVGSWQWT